MSCFRPLLVVCLCLGFGLSVAAQEAGERPEVLRLSGSPAEIGRRHGTALKAQIRLMLREYVGRDTVEGTIDTPLQPHLARRVQTMKPSLPGWYREELAACARAAGVAEELLLFAQCEGDIRSLHGCTTYVAHGEATPGGVVEMGRNFDYWGIESAEQVAVVLAVVPAEGQGHAFVSVGWAGILGGWTFVNEHGLFVANNLGGGYEKNPKGLPTLILQRLVAQQAATVPEAVALVRKLPRMRGQVLVVGHPGDPAREQPPQSVVIAYDGERVEVTPAAGGLAFHSSTGTVRSELAAQVRRRARAAVAPVKSCGSTITLHSVVVRPVEGKLWVAHGKQPSAHTGIYRQYDLEKLLRRQE